MYCCWTCILLFWIIYLMMICFCGWLTNKRSLILFAARTIVRDPHYQEYDISWPGFELVQNLNSGFDEWSCAVVITTTPQHHKMYVCRSNLFLGLNPLSPTLGFAISPLWSLPYLKIPTCTLQHSKTQLLFKNGH